MKSAACLLEPLLEDRRSEDAYGVPAIRQDTGETCDRHNVSASGPNHDQEVTDLVHLRMMYMETARKQGVRYPSG
jgi:hypothetical protein